MAEDQNELSAFDVRSDSTLSESDLNLECIRFFQNVLPRLPVHRLSEIRERCNQLIPGGDQLIAYGADYDIKVEIEGLIQAVRAMQDSVMLNGRIRPGITPKEMREVVASTTSLLSVLVKTHEKFMSLDRQRELERATIDVLKELGGEEVASQFVERMEERLSA